MKNEQAEQLHTSILECAAKVIGDGIQQAPLMLINPHGSGPQALLQINQYFRQRGKQATFDMMREFCMENRYEVVGFVDEAHILQDATQEELAELATGKAVADFPDHVDAVVIQLETATKTWVWSHVIRRDDAGNRFLDTTEEVPPGDSGEHCGLRFLA